MIGRRPRREHGQAMVEFALIAPVMFFFLFAIIETGYAYGRQLDLKGATRDGARRAAVSIDLVDADARTRTAVYDGLGLTEDDDVTITVVPPPPWEHGDRVVVSTSTPHDFRVLGVTAWSGQLRARSEIRIE